MILASTIAYFQQQYLDPVPERNGFRVKKEYTVGRNNILSNNPARPAAYYLSAYYAPNHFPFHAEAATAAQQSQQFPGKL